MDEKSNVSAKILEMFEKYKYFVIILIVGVFLMTFSFTAPKDELDKKQPVQDAGAVQSEGFNLSEFERKLNSVLSQIDSIGRVELIVSLKSSEENIYAADTKRNSKTPSSVSDGKSDNYESNLAIISDRNYGEKPVLVKSIYPEFRGVVIICDGADNDRVRLKVTEAVAALCSLTTENISIIKMKQ